MESIIMSDLKDLAKYHKSNKYDLGYIDIYEKYFRSIKDKNLNILEIGIDKGPSLKVWSEYFKNSNIAALDIVPIDLQFKNAEIFCGDQTDENFLKSIVNKFKYFDIIIDDGSHISNHVIKSFNFLFEHLSVGGLYIIEDLHYSYYPRYGGSRINLNKKNTSLNFLKSLVDSLNYENYDRPFYKKSKFNGKINSINFYQNCAVLKKGDSKVYFYKNKPKNKFINLVKKFFSILFG